LLVLVLAGVVVVVVVLDVLDDVDEPLTSLAKSEVHLILSS